jgi:hypothetical protein
MASREADNMFSADLLNDGPYDYFDAKGNQSQATIPKVEEAVTETDFRRIEARISQASLILGAITAIATIFALQRGK